MGVACTAVHPGNLLPTRLSSRAGLFYRTVYCMARPFTKSVVSKEEGQGGKERERKCGCSGDLHIKKKFFWSHLSQKALQQVQVGQHRCFTPAHSCKVEPHIKGPIVVLLSEAYFYGNLANKSTNSQIPHRHGPQYHVVLKSLRLIWRTEISKQPKSLNFVRLCVCVCVLC